MESGPWLIHKDFMHQWERQTSNDKCTSVALETGSTIHTESVHPDLSTQSLK